MTGVSSREKSSMKKMQLSLSVPCLPALIIIVQYWLRMIDHCPIPITLSIMKIPHAKLVTILGPRIEVSVLIVNHNKIQDLWKTQMFGILHLLLKRDSQFRKSINLAKITKAIKCAASLRKKKEKAEERRLFSTIVTPKAVDLIPILSKCWNEKCLIKVLIFTLTTLQSLIQQRACFRKQCCCRLKCLNSSQASVERGRECWCLAHQALVRPSLPRLLLPVEVQLSSMSLPAA